MIAASFNSIGDSCADSKGQHERERQCFRKFCHKIRIDVSSQRHGKLLRVAPRAKRTPAAGRSRFSARSLCDSGNRLSTRSRTTGGGSQRTVRFESCGLVVRAFLRCAVEAVLLLLRGPYSEFVRYETFCTRWVITQPSRLSRLDRKSRSLAARRRSQPTFPKFGPRCWNRPQTDRQGKRSSGRTSSCGFDISRS